MSSKRRKSAVRMMMVAGGLVAAVPALGAGGEPAALLCNGKPQTPSQNGAITCNGKPQNTKRIGKTKRGFFCNMAPKTNAPAATTPQTAGQSTAPGTNSQ